MKAALNGLLSQGGIVFMRLLGQLPLRLVRLLGWWLGAALYVAARPRRRVVLTNLRLCFPQWSDKQRHAVAWRHFIRFAQAWLDRGWLWHGKPRVVQRRLRLTGDVPALQAAGGVVIFAPHFVGLDAGWTALAQQMDRHLTTIYSHQSNARVDDWIKAGRARFGQVRLFDRAAGPKLVVQALRSAELLYLLPDMNYGLNESIFVPFYGVPAATVTSLSRLARLGQARVVPVVARLTPDGYDVQVMPAWTDVPSGDLSADTLKMNQRLEAWIDQCPDQYYWVHKRFKDRPPGGDAIY
jgi:Kdo2-lipid IVA lauroyltransferase/acyltransferase